MKEHIVVMDGQHCPVCHEPIVWVPSPFSANGVRLMGQTCRCTGNSADYPLVYEDDVHQ